MKYIEIENASRVTTTGLAGSAVLRAPAARRTPAGGNLTAAFLEVTEP
jgi:hypothetical protein